MFSRWKWPWAFKLNEPILKNTYLGSEAGYFQRLVLIDFCMIIIEGIQTAKRTVLKTAYNA